MFGNLANSGNNRVTTTKYMCSVHINLSINHVVLVKFYCDIIIRSHLQLINTLSTPSLVNFVPFWQNKEEEEGTPVMVKRKLDGAVDKSLAYRKIL